MHLNRHRSMETFNNIHTPQYRKRKRSLESNFDRDRYNKPVESVARTSGVDQQSNRQAYIRAIIF